MKKVLSIIALIVSIVCYILIIKINLLPAKYMIIIGTGLLIINLIAIILSFVKPKLLWILGNILAVIIMIISFVGIFYVSKTDSFLTRAFSKEKTFTTTYYILTSSKNEYTKDDIEDDIYYYNNFDIKAVKEYLKEAFDLNYKEKKNLTDMMKEVKEGTLSFVLLDQSTYSMVLEIDANLKKEDYKIVYEFDITKKIEVEEKNTKKTFTLLILGTDFANLNDLNLLVTVNLKKEKILVTTIPRAYYIEVDGKDGRKDTLSFMAPYGIDVSMKSIENYFKIDIDYYLKINTHSLVSLVDEIGGITYCSDQAYYTTHSLVLDTYVDNKGKFYVRKGCQELNGIQTLTVARERKAFYDGDRTRQKNCVKIMQAILDKMISTNTLVNYENILNSLVDLYETDIPKEEISLLAKKALNNPTAIHLDMQSVDGLETMDRVHLTDYLDYVIVPNEDTVSSAVAQIREVLK